MCTCFLLFFSEKKTMLILNTCSIHAVVIYSLTKYALEKFVKFAKKYPCRNLKKLHYLESPLFWTKCSAKHNFLGICRISNITNGANMACQMYISIR